MELTQKIRIFPKAEKIGKRVIDINERGTSKT